MDRRDDGGQAFPVHSSIGAGQDGMSLRDWFAGQALASIDTRYTKAEEYPEAYRASAEAANALSLRRTAGLAYEIADAMIAERNK